MNIYDFGEWTLVTIKNKIFSKKSSTWFQGHKPIIELDHNLNFSITDSLFDQANYTTVHLLTNGRLHSVKYPAFSSRLGSAFGIHECSSRGIYIKAKIYLSEKRFWVEYKDSSTLEEKKDFFAEPSSYVNAQPIEDIMENLTNLKSQKITSECAKLYDLNEDLFIESKINLRSFLYDMLVESSRKINHFNSTLEPEKASRKIERLKSRNSAKLMGFFQGIRSAKK